MFTYARKSPELGLLRALIWQTLQFSMTVFCGSFFRGNHTVTLGENIFLFYLLNWMESGTSFQILLGGGANALPKQNRISQRIFYWIWVSPQDTQTTYLAWRRSSCSSISRPFLFLPLSPILLAGKRVWGNHHQLPFKKDDCPYIKLPRVVMYVDSAKFLYKPLSRLQELTALYIDGYS